MQDVKLSAEKASQKKSILYDFSIEEIYDYFSNGKRKKSNELVEVSHDSSSCPVKGSLTL